MKARKEKRNKNGKANLKSASRGRATLPEKSEKGTKKDRKSVQKGPVKQRNRSLKGKPKSKKKHVKRRTSSGRGEGWLQKGKITQQQGSSEREKSRKGQARKKGAGFCTRAARKHETFPVQADSEWTELGSPGKKWKKL